MGRAGLGGRKAKGDFLGRAGTLGGAWSGDLGYIEVLDKVSVGGNLWPFGHFRVGGVKGDGLARLGALGSALDDALGGFGAFVAFSGIGDFRLFGVWGGKMQRR